MSRARSRNLIRGPIATLPTPMKKDYSIDYGVMAELTHWWVEQGVTSGRAPLKVAAAMGEGPDLGDDEWPVLLRTVVDNAGPTASVICALKPKDTLHTIEDAKKAEALGAIGLQIDLPIFHHPTQDDLVRFFTDISDEINIGIMIYNTFWFGAESITAETMNRLRDAENVIAIKWVTPPEQNYDDMAHFVDHFNVIDNAGQPIRCAKNGGHGYIDPTMAVNPQHSLKVWDLCLDGRYDEAESLFDSVRGPYLKVAGRAGARSGGYNVLKAMMAVVGKPVGPPRPPTLPLNDEEFAELRALVDAAGWHFTSTPS